MYRISLLLMVVTLAGSLAFAAGTPLVFAADTPATEGDKTFCVSGEHWHLSFENGKPVKTLLEKDTDPQDMYIKNKSYAAKVCYVYVCKPGTELPAKDVNGISLSTHSGFNKLFGVSGSVFATKPPQPGSKETCGDRASLTIQQKATEAPNCPAICFENGASMDERVSSGEGAATMQSMVKDPTVSDKMARLQEEIKDLAKKDLNAAGNADQLHQKTQEYEALAKQNKGMIDMIYSNPQTPAQQEAVQAAGAQVRAAERLKAIAGNAFAEVDAPGASGIVSADTRVKLNTAIENLDNAVKLAPRMSVGGSTSDSWGTVSVVSSADFVSVPCEGGANGRCLVAKEVAGASGSSEQSVFSRLTTFGGGSVDKKERVPESRSSSDGSYDRFLGGNRSQGGGFEGQSGSSLLQSFMQGFIRGSQQPSSPYGNGSQAYQSQPKPEIVSDLSCSSGPVDVGAKVTLAWKCSDLSQNPDVLRSSAIGFSTGGALSGTRTLVAAPVEGQHSMTYSLVCTKLTSKRTDQCSVQFNRPSLVFIANPNPFNMGDDVQFAWTSFGTRSCVVTSPDIPGFSKPGVGGVHVFESSSLKPVTRVVVSCITVPGNVYRGAMSISISGGSVSVTPARIVENAD